MNGYVPADWYEQAMAEIESLKKASSGQPSREEVIEECVQVLVDDYGMGEEHQHARAIRMLRAIKKESNPAAAQETRKGLSGVNAYQHGGRPMTLKEIAEAESTSPDDKLQESPTKEK